LGERYPAGIILWKDRRGLYLKVLPSVLGATLKFFTPLTI
jgi:hypothetical protein